MNLPPAAQVRQCGVSPAATSMGSVGVSCVHCGLVDDMTTRLKIERLMGPKGVAWEGQRAMAFQGMGSRTRWCTTTGQCVASRGGEGANPCAGACALAPAAKHMPPRAQSSRQKSRCRRGVRPVRQSGGRRRVTSPMGEQQQVGRHTNPRSACEGGWSTGGCWDLGLPLWLSTICSREDDWGGFGGSWLARADPPTHGWTGFRGGRGGGVSIQPSG